MADKTTLISFRIDEDTAKAFKQIAQSNNRNQSILLRDWVIEYVKKTQADRNKIQIIFLISNNKKILMQRDVAVMHMSNRLIQAIASSYPSP